MTVMDVMNVKQLIIEIELYFETRELKQMNLTDEEILGYIEYYWDHWFGK